MKLFLKYGSRCFINSLPKHNDKSSYIIYLQSNSFCISRIKQTIEEINGHLAQLVDTNYRASKDDYKMLLNQLSALPGINNIDLRNLGSKESTIKSQYSEETQLISNLKVLLSQDIGKEDSANAGFMFGLNQQMLMMFYNKHNEHFLKSILIQKLTPSLIQAAYPIAISLNQLALYKQFQISDDCLWKGLLPNIIDLSSQLNNYDYASFLRLLICYEKEVLISNGKQQVDSKTFIELYAEYYRRFQKETKLEAQLDFARIITTNVFRSKLNLINLNFATDLLKAFSNNLSSLSIFDLSSISNLFVMHKELIPRVDKMFPKELYYRIFSTVYKHDEHDRYTILIYDLAIIYNTLIHIYHDIELTNKLIVSIAFPELKQENLHLSISLKKFSGNPSEFEKDLHSKRVIYSTQIIANSLLHAKPDPKEKYLEFYRSLFNHLENELIISKLYGRLDPILSPFAFIKMKKINKLIFNHFFDYYLQSLKRIMKASSANPNDAEEAKFLILSGSRLFSELDREIFKQGFKDPLRYVHEKEEFWGLIFKVFQKFTNATPTVLPEIKMINEEMKVLENLCNTTSELEFKEIYVSGMTSYFTKLSKFLISKDQKYSRTLASLSLIIKDVNFESVLKSFEFTVIELFDSQSISLLAEVVNGVTQSDISNYKLPILLKKVSDKISENCVNSDLERIDRHYLREFNISTCFFFSQALMINSIRNQHFLEYYEALVIKASDLEHKSRSFKLHLINVFSYFEFGSDKIWFYFSSFLTNHMDEIEVTYFYFIVAASSIMNQKYFSAEFFNVLKRNLIAKAKQERDKETQSKLNTAIANNKELMQDQDFLEKYQKENNIKIK